MDSGDFEGALEAYGDTIRSYPEKAAAYYFRGDVLARLERFEQSAADFRAHLEMVPANGAAAMALYSSLCKLGRFDQAFTEAMRFRDSYRLIEEPESVCKVNVSVKTSEWLDEMTALGGQSQQTITEYGQSFADWWFSKD